MRFIREMIARKAAGEDEVQSESAGIAADPAVAATSRMLPVHDDVETHANSADAPNHLAPPAAEESYDEDAELDALDASLPAFDEAEPEEELFADIPDADEEDGDLPTLSAEEVERAMKLRKKIWHSLPEDNMDFLERRPEEDSMVTRPIRRVSEAAAAAAEVEQQEEDEASLHVVHNSDDIERELGASAQDHAEDAYYDEYEEDDEVDDTYAQQAYLEETDPEAAARASRDLGSEPEAVSEPEPEMDSEPDAEPDAEVSAQDDDTAGEDIAGEDTAEVDADEDVASWLAEVDGDMLRRSEDEDTADSGAIFSEDFGGDAEDLEVGEDLADLEADDTVAADETLAEDDTVAADDAWQAEDPPAAEEGAVEVAEQIEQPEPPPEFVRPAAVAAPEAPPVQTPPPTPTPPPAAPVARAPEAPAPEAPAAASRAPLANDTPAPGIGDVDIQALMARAALDAASQAPRSQPAPAAEPQAPAEQAELPAAPSGGRRGGRVKTRLLGFQADDGPEDVFENVAARTDGSTQADTKFPVGWMVVVSGPGRGSSFSLHNGVSLIGRGEDQSIRLDFGDTSISRNNHASVAFDDESGAFYLGHGGKSNIVRLNGKPVLSTEELNHGDKIRIGETTLRFAALCDADFNWSDDAGNGANNAATA